MSTVCDWYMVDDEAITHFCAGTTDEKKNNKPKGTQIDTSKWFNPTTLDEETKVSKCNACASEHQPGEPVTIIGGS